MALTIGTTLKTFVRINLKRNSIGIKFKMNGDYMDQNLNLFENKKPNWSCKFPTSD